MIRQKPASSALGGAAWLVAQALRNSNVNGRLLRINIFMAAEASRKRWCCPAPVLSLEAESGRRLPFQPKKNAQIRSSQAGNNAALATIDRTLNE